MLPIGTNTSAYTIQTPIVNTTTPGTSVVHVPPDTVAPSVSNSQVDNNSKGNNATAQAQEEQAAAAAEAANEQASQSTAASDSIDVSSQAAFIAQLAAQDDNQPTHILLQQYEKLVEYSDVKYKPSNAFKPSAAPSSVFTSLVTHEKPEEA